MTRFNIKSSILVGLASLLCSSVGVVKANEGWTQGCGPERNWDCCPTNDCCPQHTDCGAFIGAQLLIWTACQNNFDFDFKESTNRDCWPVHDVHFADYDWSCGYRIYGGYRLGCDNWDIAAVFTHWDNSASGSVDYNDFIGTECECLDVKSIAKNELRYSTLDILLARNYQLSCTSVFQPFFGFRGMWLSQDWRHKLNFPDVSFHTVDLESKLFAAGIHAGTDFKWQVCDCFGVYAVAAATLAEGKVDNRHTGYERVCPAFGLITKEKFCMPIAGYNLAAGISYESDCVKACGCEGWVEFMIGYEFNHWFNVPDHRRDLLDSDFHSSEALVGFDTSTKGVLDLHGLHLGATVYF